MDSSRLELQRMEYNTEFKRLDEALQAHAETKNKLRSLEMEQLELDLQFTAPQNRSRRLSEEHNLVRQLIKRFSGGRVPRPDANDPITMAFWSMQIDQLTDGCRISLARLEVEMLQCMEDVKELRKKTMEGLFETEVKLEGLRNEQLLLDAEADEL
ncbi:hypothetical protein OEA41_006919 [Lepraria neglecta]|uniref:Uncharacterized protein n=1 Tax=Lepraria neglecta TaxID=209136 RepID=A0AAD9ZC37_9LECA|nr:hypothetical protein OEA41_006919 [Lepraria neglecta]